MALSKIVASYLFGIKPSDPAAFVGVAAITIAVSVLACLLPSRRAARVDPMTALRRE